MTFPDTELPTHPRTGLRAVGIGRRGPIWPILGGDGNGDGGSAAAQQGTGGGDGTGASGDGGQQQPGESSDGTQPGQSTGDGGQQPPKPTPPAPKTFTQAELDAIIQKRMTGFEQSFGKKMADLFGGQKATDGDGALKPEAVLQQAQQMLDGARQQANAATAESLARAAGIKDERIGTFIGLVGLAGALKDVDQADPAAVKTALKAAIDAKAGEFPEWKTSSVASSSGGDRGQAAGGKKTWTRAELEAMSADELVKNNAEIQAAAREGRIK